MTLVLRQRLSGRMRRGRMRLASAALTFGACLHLWVGDLGFAISPLLARRPGRAPSPWLGLAVVALLLLGLGTAGGGALWLLGEAVTHREVRP